MTVELLKGDCRAVMDMLPAESIDACVTDPPYHLTSTVKRFGKPGSAPAQFGKDGAFARASRGFMGQEWDGGDIAFQPAIWAEVLRLLKPGAHLVAFSGTRTYHRMACAIEDAGFEIRDQLAWVYGTGFPKSHNQGDGWGTALKPAWEPIVLARKPSIGTVAQNRAQYGTGGINIEACRVSVDPVADAGQFRTMQRGQRMGDANGQVWGLSKGGGDAPQVVRPEGRWPANILHDGSDEVLAAFPDAPGQQGDLKETGRARPTKHAFGDMAPPRAHSARNDAGSAARFFYCAKASGKDRGEGNEHPTVKPTVLMQWLCRLITPVGGVVLDPFMGSGSTGKAAIREGFDFVGVEQSAEYFEIAKRRVA